MSFFSCITPQKKKKKYMIISAPIELSDNEQHFVEKIYRKIPFLEKKLSEDKAKLQLMKQIALLHEGHKDEPSLSNLDLRREISIYERRTSSNDPLLDELTEKQRKRKRGHENVTDQTISNAIIGNKIEAKTMKMFDGQSSNSSASRIPSMNIDREQITPNSNTGEKSHLQQGIDAFFKNKALKDKPCIVGFIYKKY